MLNFRKIANLRIPKRKYSTGNLKMILENLKERCLIRLAGQDVTAFLQGLITNDIHHLGQHSGGCSMYTMFLNTKGRVLYDSIIYRTEESNTYFVECDNAALTSIQKHLKIYRVKRKVEIVNLVEEYKIYALYKYAGYNLHSNDILKSNNVSHKFESILPEGSSVFKKYKDLLIFKDPRVVELGSRILAKVGTNVNDQIKEIISNVELPTSQINYKTFRYSLGIGEGVNDLPVGNCFPLECNCDYLHGVSFHKGCYIGQELTARTHHTGAVRKRLMPLYFSKIPITLPTDNVILNKNVNLGRLRGVNGNTGLGLLRIDKALDFGEFSVGNGIAKTIKPSWWPIEAPKERVYTYIENN